MFFLFVWSTNNIKKEVFFVIAPIMLFFYAANMYGNLYAYADYGGAYYERTLEYEDDMKANLLLIKTLENKYRNNIIVTTWPFAHMLVSPEIGYVKEPFEVITMGRKCFSWKGVKHFSEIDIDDSKINDRLIWISHKSVFNWTIHYDPRIDTKLEMIHVGKKKIYIFKRNLMPPQN